MEGGTRIDNLKRHDEVQNAHSSRSHAIVILTVERKAKNFSEPASEASDRPHSGSSAGFLEGERCEDKVNSRPKL